MTKALTPEEKEAKKKTAEEKAAREAEAKAAAEAAATEEVAKKEAEEKAAAEELARKEAEEKAAREAEEQAAIAAAAAAKVEPPASPVTSYTNTAEGKAERDAQAADMEKAGKQQPTDEKAAELKTIGLQILENYPNEQTVYMTANGFGFFKHSDARNHADTLPGKEILTVNRE